MPGPLLSSARTWPESINAAATTATVKSRRMPHALTRDLVREAADDDVMMMISLIASPLRVDSAEEYWHKYGVHERGDGEGSHHPLNGPLLRFQTGLSSLCMMMISK